MTDKRAIAIIDDDALVRSSLVSLVRSFGLDATAFDCAVSFLDAGPEHWSGLISDVHMPRMTGLELAGRLQVSHPLLPVILITAFPDGAMFEQGRMGVAARLLEKPCASEAIQAALEDILGPI